jgi:hypothetical protein
VKTFPCILLILLALTGCSGSRKYFKAAEKLEKQGLVNEAAEYYLESLTRKPTNVEARIKLKEVGQKYVSSLSSEFFREFNTQQLDASLETYERLRDFHGRCEAMNVHLDYPRTYDEDYQKQVELYCAKHYHQAQLLVRQKKYQEAQAYILKVKKYNSNYRNLQQLEIVATCEPLYQNAISSLENKNYGGAYNLLMSIRSKTENYKDLADLIELAGEQQRKSFILFEPHPGEDRMNKEIADYLFSNFSQAAQQKSASIKVINNSPFQESRSSTDLSNAGNIDMVQAIRKATGADYFYLFDIRNRREYNSGVKRTPSRGFQENRYKKGEEVVTEYKPFDYNNLRSQRSYSYEFRYKLVNAYTNQIVSSGTEVVKAQDEIEYNEFTSPTVIQQLFGKANPTAGDIGSLFPYNPHQTAVLAQYNPRPWRALFSARTSLKPFDDLRLEAMRQNVNMFDRVFQMMK